MKRPWPTHTSVQPPEPAKHPHDPGDPGVLLATLEGSLAAVASRAPAPLREGVTVALTGGRRIRSQLLLAAAAPVHTTSKSLALRHCLCLELLHAATLVQDDIFDGSPLRRGAPAVHAAVGANTAVLVSDWLLLEAIREAYRCSPAFGDALSLCAQRLATGEAREWQPPAVCSVGVLKAHARRVAEEKTGALFGAALFAAAALRGLRPGGCAAWEQAGQALGRAFQYLDDALDLLGTASLAGKPLGVDRSLHLLTAPMLDLLEEHATSSPVPLPWTHQALENTAWRLWRQGGDRAVLAYCRSEWAQALRALATLGQPAAALRAFTGTLGDMLLETLTTAPAAPQQGTAGEAAADEALATTAA